LLPNDEREQDRLDLQHHLFRLVLDGDLTYSKVNEPQRILDVGTGTGVWAIDVGDLYPESEVLGVDLSPIQPTWTPVGRASNMATLHSDTSNDTQAQRQIRDRRYHARVDMGS
jgi:cyclopropane fatty-acyl-phospholipid synthase-like methyltransferase